MKYCNHCGTQLVDEAVVCPNCGCSVQGNPANTAEGEASALRTVAKIFMLLSCIAFAFFIIPLCWTIPMTVHYWKAVNNRQPVGIGFKVCTLLFVNTISGVLMLCDSNG